MDMDKTLFEQLDLLNKEFLRSNQKKQEKVHSTYRVKKSPDPTQIATGAIVGSLFGPIGALIGGTLSASGTSFLSSNYETIDYELDSDVIIETENARLLDSLKKMVPEWTSILSYDDQITACVALINACALFDVTEDNTTQLFSHFYDVNTKELLLNFTNLAYKFLRTQNSSPERILASLLQYDNPKCPQIISLYLFHAAVSAYLPDETNAEMYQLASRCLGRMSREYKSFALMDEKTPLAGRSPSSTVFLPRLIVVDGPIEHKRLPKKDVGKLSYSEKERYLHLSTGVSFSQSAFMSLPAKLQTLFNSQEFAYQAAEGVHAIQSILRDFAHTYGNMKATRLHEIADALFSASKKYDDPELLKLARLTILEAKKKQDLTTGIQLMHLKCREDVVSLTEKLQNSIADSSNENTETQGIHDLLDYALHLCAYRVFYDASDKKAQIAQRNLANTLGWEKFKSLRESFEDAVIMESKPCLEWFQSVPIPIMVETHDDWEIMKLNNDSFASVFLVDLFAELFFNSFKYADLSKPVTFLLYKDGDYLTASITNSVSSSASNYVSGSGLVSRNETLAILNRRTDSITWSVDENGFFVTTLRILSSLFLS